jgi:hypothetical protein
MEKCKFLLVVAAVVALAPSIPTPAGAQSRNALSIADNDSIYVDGRSFKVTPGNAKGDASALIKQLGARDLGPAAIIFRKGNKLYVAADPLDQQRYGSDRRDYGSDRRDYGSDRRDYGSDREESPSTAQSEREWREWQESLRDYGSDRRDYGSDRYADYASRRDCESRDYGGDRRDCDRRDYGSDRAGEPNQQRMYVNDPDYAQYRLKKFFDENWTTSDTR